MKLDGEAVTLYTDEGKPVHVKLDDFIRGLIEYIKEYLEDDNNEG